MTPKVALIMGSDSDFEKLKSCVAKLKEFKIEVDVNVISAHRTPDRMYEYAHKAHENGIKVIIAGAGGAAHLPGMTAAMTSIPVIGVPVKTSTLSGVDSLYSICQMPPGIPVATVAINGAQNAGILAAQILGSFDEEIYKKVQDFKKGLEETVLKKAEKLEDIKYSAYLEDMKK